MVYVVFYDFRLEMPRFISTMTDELRDKRIGGHSQTKLLDPGLYHCPASVREQFTPISYLHAGGTMSRVVFTTVDAIDLRADGSFAWLAAIKLIMLRVLPKPISSASRPPRKSGGAWPVLYPLTLLI